MAKAKELERFSKQEIIEALARKFDRLEEKSFDSTISNIIFDINCQRQKNILEEQIKLNDKIDAALTELVNWKKYVVEKYGKNGKVNLLDLPREEIEKGVKVGESYQTLYQQEKQLEQKLQEYFRGSKCN